MSDAKENQEKPVEDKAASDQTLREYFDSLKLFMDLIQDDFSKLEQVNKSAGTRVRTVLLDMKKTADKMRKKILAQNKEKPIKKRAQRGLEKPTLKREETGV